jgi:hypothetical protein
MIIYKENDLEKKQINDEYIKPSLELYGYDIGSWPEENTGTIVYKTN